MMKNFRKTGARLIWVCCIIAVFVASLPAFALAEEDSVADALRKGTLSPDAPAGGQQPAAIPGSETGSMWGYLLQVIFSLGVIVVLIYLLLRFLGRRQMGQAHGPIKVISAAPLGNGKTIQLVMIGESLYLLGVGENVQLLKHIPPGEEADLILAEAEIKPIAGFSLDWLPFGRKRQTEEEEIHLSAADGRTFEELLHKQWNDLDKQSDQAGSWMEKQGHDRGDRG
jgi:flagellar protein FliO/FliZ